MKIALITIISLQALVSIYLCGKQNELIDDQQTTINTLMSQNLDHQFNERILRSQLLAKTKQNSIVSEKTVSSMDYMLKQSDWRCSEWGRKFEFSSQEFTPGVMRYWMGATRQCVKFERMVVA